MDNGVSALLLGSISYRNIGMVIKGTRNANFIRKNPAKEKKKGGGALRLKRSFLKKENNISKTENIQLEAK